LNSAIVDFGLLVMDIILVVKIVVLVFVCLNLVVILN